MNIFATKHDLDLLRRDSDINTITLKQNQDSLKENQDSLKDDLNEMKELLLEMSERINHSLKEKGRGTLCK